LREALQHSPNNLPLRQHYAQTLKQGKSSQALVIAEDVAKNSRQPAKAHLLVARIHYRNGEIPQAVRAYHSAIEADPSVEDSELRVRLGIQATPETSEVVEGKVPAFGAEPAAGADPAIERPKIVSRMRFG
jgi:hypothetical protein